MDGQGDSYIPPKLCLRGVKKGFNNTSKYTFGPGEIKHYDHLFVHNNIELYCRESPFEIILKYFMEKLQM